MNIPGTIKAIPQIVKDLHGMTGKITKKKTIQRKPKVYHYWFRFKQPITKEGNLKGWKGIWLPLNYINTNGIKV